MIPLQLILAVLLSWLRRQEHETIEYLRAENRILKAQLQGGRLRLTDDERRRLAVLGLRRGRRVLTQVATIVTPDTFCAGALNGQYERQAVAAGPAGEDASHPRLWLHGHVRLSDLTLIAVARDGAACRRAVYAFEGHAGAVL